MCEKVRNLTEMGENELDRCAILEKPDMLEAALESRCSDSIRTQWTKYEGHLHIRKAAMASPRTAKKIGRL